MSKKFAVITPIEQLLSFMRMTYRNVGLALTAPLYDDGVWFVNVLDGTTKLTIEWSAATGFGVSKMNDDSFGERPDEAFVSIEDVKRRIAEILS